MRKAEIKEQFKDFHEKLDYPKLDERGKNYLLGFGAVMLVILLTAAIPAVTDSKETSDSTGTVGNDTTVDYRSSNVTRETAAKVLEAVKETGWNGTESSLRKIRPGWYRVNITTRLSARSELTIDQRYQAQRTITVIHHRAFQKTDTVEVNIKASDGTVLTRFTQ